MDSLLMLLIIENKYNSINAFLNAKDNKDENICI